MKAEDLARLKTLCRRANGEPCEPNPGKNNGGIKVAPSNPRKPATNAAGELLLKNGVAKPARKVRGARVKASTYKGSSAKSQTKASSFGNVVSKYPVKQPRIVANRAPTSKALNKAPAPNTKAPKQVKSPIAVRKPAAKVQKKSPSTKQALKAPAQAVKSAVRKAGGK
ncbi:hypothetical protein BDQ17DRAFT_1350640 [Cyathus striatus]|nr:hypothetical protein BDQ17DRAFT_1350640 [Cyathus striatus]